MRVRKTPNGLTRLGKSTAQMVLVSPTALIIRYRGIASVDAGTRMAPKIIEKIRLRPRKTYLASAYPAIAAKEDIVVGEERLQIREQIKVGCEPQPEGAEQIGLTLGRRDDQPEKGYQKVECEDEQDGHDPNARQIEAARAFLPGGGQFLGSCNRNSRGLLAHSGYTPACRWVTRSTLNEKIQVITANTTERAAV